MLTYCSGTDLHDLAGELLNQFDNNPPVNPLSPEIFIVQNHGMAQWLSFHIAEERGIAANLKFEFPAERIWALIRMMDSDIPETLPSDRIPMAWSILNLLKNDNDPALGILQEYAREEDPLKREMRRWKLAGRIADVFDQYLTYRPEMLTSWEAKDNPPVTEFPEERWQSILWRKLVNYWHADPETHHEHRALLQQKLLEAIEKETINREGLPQRISVFGVSTMPPIYLRILVKLAGLTDVYFYALEPAEEFDHPIRESMGTTGKEYRSLLNSYISQHEIEAEYIDLRKKKGTPNSVLESFKQSLQGFKSETAVNPKDPAVTIHSCHSARREVEVLYDRLLAMFEQDESLNPSDVLVVAPDLTSYSTEIKAVFDTIEESLPKIPFHLAENDKGHVNPVVKTVLKLLELADSRFKVTDVVDLLDCKPLQHKFGFTEEDLKTLERWIDDNRIRWGIDKISKGAIGLPETDSFTWQSGLDRMMLGYAMQAGDDKLFNGIYPYQEVERSEDALLVGRFAHLMTLLFNFHDDIQESKSLSHWAGVFRKWLFRFIPEDEDFFHATQRLRRQLEKLEKMEGLSGFHGKTPYRIVREYLKTELEEKKGSGGRSGTGVTFSSMVPVRNIPAKVICILGMNDSKFPRSKMPVAFDLINKSPKTGDRSHSNEDRQLFLETVLAAEKRLYISYTGQSNRQDSDYPPSVVLRELQDYLLERYGLDKDRLVTKHPLQSFSPKYFRIEREQGLFSYSSKNRSIAGHLLASNGDSPPFLSSDLPEPKEDFQRVSVSELVRFFQHPAKYLLQNRFGMYLNHEKILDEDREPFQLKGLEGYKLGQELLDRYLNNQSTEAFKQVAKSTSMLPEGYPGEEAYFEKLSDVERFVREIQVFLGQKKIEPLEVDFEINDFRITGKLHELYEHEQALYRFGRMRSKEHIELWLKHLVLQEAMPEGFSGMSKLYAFSSKKGIESVQLPALKDHRAILTDIVDIYRKGISSNTFFFPDTSFSYAENIYSSGKEMEKALKAAGKQWKDEYASYPKEGDDPYNKLLVRDTNPLQDKSFRQISDRFWKPYFSNLTSGEV